MADTREDPATLEGDLQEDAPRDDEPKFITQAFGVVEEEDYIEDRAGVPIRCQFCVGQKFRRSRLRSSDIRSLLLMRYPVRCLRCAQRQLVSFTIAGISIASRVRPQRRRQSLQQKARKPAARR